MTNESNLQFSEEVDRQIAELLNTPPNQLSIDPQTIAIVARALGASGARMVVYPSPRSNKPQIFTYGIQPQTNAEIEKTASWQKSMYSQGSASATPMSYITWVDDIYEDPLLEALFRPCRAVGIRSLTILPLRYSHQCVGCITLFGLDDCSVPVSNTTSVKLASTLAIHLYLAIVQQQIEQMFHHQAYYDVVTGLPNRLLLHQRLTIALAKRQEAGDILAAICIDLERFKTINDSLGHAFGDRLLQLVASRLKVHLDRDIIIGRWGGDEFTLLVPGLTNVTEVEEVAESILNCFARPFEFERPLPTLDTELLYIKISMGIALAPYDGEDSETLLKHADAALHRAKQPGRNDRYELYTSVISDRSIQKLRLEHILYQAIDRDQLLLHYQPKIDTKTHKIIGAEALLRCQDYAKKLISPADFIPIAEETGSIGRIGEWVIREACKQNKIWQDAGLLKFPIAVNLSIKQLQEQNPIETIVNILSETGLSPHYLEVEITESIAIQDLDLTIAILQSLRAIGVQVSLDDFGTGYSSLASLKHLPLDYLKVDRSFVNELSECSVDAGIVKTIVSLAHGLNLKAIAEGVETKEQLAFLESIGCDAVQGYLFSRPIPAVEFTKMLLDPVLSGARDSLKTSWR
jgi:diguanylate cyclase (GGDEF)-like protein